MRKEVKVKGYFTKKGEYRKGYIGHRYCSSHSKPIKMTLSRKVIALRKFTDRQSQEYQEVTGYLMNECPEALEVIQRQRSVRRLPQKVKDAINYAYGILYT